MPQITAARSPATPSSGWPAAAARLGGSRTAHAAFAALVLWALMEAAPLVDAAAGDDPRAPLLLGTAAVVLLAAFVSSIAGFAFAALAGSALAHLGTNPVDAVQMMATCSIATQLYAVWRLRASIEWRGLWAMVAAGLATVPLGVWLLLHASGAGYAVGLGIFLTAYGAYVALRGKTRVRRGSGAI